MSHEGRGVSGIPLVLDAAGLDSLASARPTDAVRALLHEAYLREREVIVPTVVVAEVARGRHRTRSVESVAARHDTRRGERPAIRLIDTDFALARQVGGLLEAADRGTESIVDAHVVAVCIPHGGGLVATSDPDDIAAIAQSLPAVRVRTTLV